MKYIDLIVDNRSDSTDNPYTYGCEDDSVSVGSRVLVPFANGNRLRKGYVASVMDNVADDMKAKLKFVEEVDEEVSLTPEMMRTAVWLRNRYLCRYIDAVRCFTPAGEKAKRREKKDPFAGREDKTDPVEKLTEQQTEALEKITRAIEEGKHARFLIHGVTGSGKTEIYIRAADKTLAQGKNVIVLVPEISLTTQTIDRFTGRFGSGRMAVLHSRMTPGERYDQWKKIRDGRVDIVIGARSAVFAPLEDIGLIVMDEEHEATYKSDQTPKYDTVEVAIKRLQDRDNGGVLILGSATPSVVTYSRARDGIYQLLELTERYNKVCMPEVSVVDMRSELKSGNRSMISRELYVAMKEELERGKQVMLFLNRRGYSTFISCRECGYVARCPSCGLSLTYHKESGRTVCHYCGYSCQAPHQCPECGSKYIKYFGSGTEKVEETITQLFPGYVTERIDLDSVRKKGELERKLKEFGKGKTHILIGTQLIAKGLDFRNVGLVGIISADVSLNIPDFRSPERTLQLIIQAAGRAGRGDEKGRVIIQTYSPEHYAVTFAAAQDYKGFFETEITLRMYMGYPPFSDMFQVVFSSKDKEAALRGAESWYGRLRAVMDPDERGSVFPPQEAYMKKINDTYRYSMLIKCARGKRREYSAMISMLKEEDRKNRKKKYTAVVDVNPYSFV